jgi:hypothetical protein
MLHKFRSSRRDLKSRLSFYQMFTREKLWRWLYRDPMTSLGAPVHSQRVNNVARARLDFPGEPAVRHVYVNALADGVVLKPCLRGRGCAPAAIAAVVVLCYAVGGYLGSAEMFGDPPRWRRMNRGPADFGLPSETVSVNSKDGIPLKAWWLPASGTPRGAVIIAHGILSVQPAIVSLESTMRLFPKFDSYWHSSLAAYC